MNTEKIQLLLCYHGCLSIEDVDGIWGPISEAGTRKFQKWFGGLEVDGIPGVMTQKALKHAVPYGLEPSTEPADSVTTQPGNETGTFWDNIKYFTRHEFRCPCNKYCNGFPVEPQEALVKEVDLLRETLGVAVIVVPPDGHSGGSGVRCQTYNDSLKGSVSNSRHLAGKAADCIVPASLAAKVEAHLAQRKATGKIRYWYKISSGSYHLDVE